MVTFPQKDMDTYICSLCRRAFQSKGGITSHATRVHTGDLKFEVIRRPQPPSTHTGGPPLPFQMPEPFVSPYIVTYDTFTFYNQFHDSTSPIYRFMLPLAPPIRDLCAVSRRCVTYLMSTLFSLVVTDRYKNYITQPQAELECSQQNRLTT